MALHPQQIEKFENENTENVKSKNTRKVKENNSENNLTNVAHAVVYWDTSPSKTTLKTTLKTLMWWFTGTPARPKQL